MIALSNIYGLLKIQGPEAKKFLQGQLTCDLDSLTPNTQTFGAHCNPQGRVISLFRLYQADEAYYLCMEKNMLTIALGQLKKYAVFYKTALTIADDVQIYGTLEQREIILHIPGINLTAEHQNSTNHLTKWRIAEINAGIPTIYQETSGIFLPHELNLPALNAVSFVKGCYTGQEIIARMQYRGKLKKHLYRVKMMCDTTLMPGADIYYNNNETTEIVGKLVDFCQLEDDHYLALVVAEATKIATNPFFLNKNQRILLTVEQ